MSKKNTTQGKFILRSKKLKPTGYAYAPRKYVSQVLNLCSSNSQATRPKNVGQMSDLVEESGARSQIEWSRWYRSRNAGCIDNAVDTIEHMLQNILLESRKITREEITEWVEDLILHKTFYGIRVQDAILRETSSLLGVGKYRLASPAEEAKGIDGFLGSMAVQVKPSTYKQKSALPEKLSVPVIYYQKKGADIEVDISELK
jgi:hypothetical protein